MKSYKICTGEIFKPISHWLNITTLVVTPKSRYYTTQNNGIVDGFYYKKRFYSLDQIPRFRNETLFEMNGKKTDLELNGYIPVCNILCYHVCLHPSFEKVKLFVRE